MVSLVDTNAATFAYDFDGDGNRLKQSGSGCLSARYVYDGPNVVLDLNASNQVARAYLNGPGIDQPIERIDYIAGTARGRYVYHTDGLGSVAAITDSSQLTAHSYTYEAFGKIRSETGNALVVNRYTYTAREALGDSAGLYYYRWRVMDPNVGRFISEDLAGFVDGPNLYTYVGNNPIFYSDPLGLEVSACARNIAGIKPGVHTWTEVDDSEGRTTYSGTDVKPKDGNLDIVKDSPLDINPTKDNPITSKTIIPPPKGMTQEQWDKACRKSAEDLKKKNDKEKRRFGPFRAKKGTNIGNCNSVTVEIIEGAGGKIPEGYDPGWGWTPGF